MTIDNLDGIFQPHSFGSFYVVLEGDPGAGKTSYFRRIARAEMLELPELDHLASGKELAGEDIEDWYLTEEIKRQRHIRSSLARGISVIQDRSLLTTIGVAWARYAPNEFSRFLNKLRRLSPLIAPDWMIIFTLSPMASLARRRECADRSAYAIWFEESFITKLHAFYSSSNIGRVARHVSLVDTTFRDVESVHRCVLEMDPIAVSTHW